MKARWLTCLSLAADAATALMRHLAIPQARTAFAGAGIESAP
ncbi:MAG: hypothetical protein ABI460_05780 [Caldimonas sp.]